MSAEVITDDALDWLSTTDGPFFCWAHYMDVHHPCYPPRAYRDAYDVGGVSQSTVQEWYTTLVRDHGSLPEVSLSKLHRLYDAAIAYTDGQIGRLVDFLREDGRYDETLVVFTSDHGELFGEYDTYGKPFRMYDELLHVPLVVANGPDVLDAAKDQLVSLLDAPPLTHQALGLDVPSAYEGRRPGIDGTRTHVLAEHEVDGEVVVGARSERWLYEGDEIENERRLYEIVDGDFERVPIDGVPEADELEAVVLDRLDRLDVDAHSLEDSVDGDVRDRLEDLGYL